MPWSTRRVAVYLETHCNIGSKRAFPTGVLDRWHNCLLIYWRNVALLPRPHRFVYLCVMSQQYIHGDPRTIAENLGRYISGSQRTSQGKDFELILTVKIETRHPVGRSFSREFSAFVIIAELWRPEVARPGNFVSTFCVFWKNDPYETVASARIAPKICEGQPPHLAHIIPDLIKSVHFRRSYWRTREDRFCPLECLQYRFFDL